MMDEGERTLDLGGGLAGHVLMELETLVPSASRALTGRELARLERTNPRRRPAYLGARIVLKRLARKLAASALDPRSIETVAEDGVRPCLRAPGLAGDYRVSVSHDRRFVVAVAADRPVGIDVERVSPSMVGGMWLYLSEAEGKRAAAFGELAQAVARAWTLKEALAKAADLPLTRVWSAAEIIAFGDSESTARIAGETITARHRVIGGHVFSVLILPEGHAAHRLAAERSGPEG